jgi:hypothetical protein
VTCGGRRTGDGRVSRELARREYHKKIERKRRDRTRCAPAAAFTPFRLGTLSAIVLPASSRIPQPERKCRDHTRCAVAPAPTPSPAAIMGVE